MKNFSYIALESLSLTVTKAQIPKESMVKQMRQWRNIDNAGKIFPARQTCRNPCVYRCTCELHEKIDAELLLQALKDTVAYFPFFQVEMKHGIFWYYFEDSDLPVEISEDNLSPCSQIYREGLRGLLYRVTYWNNRINLEVFHSLSDGGGAMYFMRILIIHYLMKAHKDIFKGMSCTDFFDVPIEAYASDGYEKYYENKPVKPAAKQQKAFRVKGRTLPNGVTHVIRGVISTKQILRLCHQRGVSIGEFLTAVYISSIHETMNKHDEKKPVIILIPINLRKYFPSESAKNFTAIMRVSHNFREEGKDFDSILNHLHETFQTMLTPEKVHEAFNQFVALEHNVAIKLVPLFIKSPVMRISAILSDKCNTSTLSNLGRIVMPKEFIPYIKLFDFCFSTQKMNISVGSFEDNMCISFTSAVSDIMIPRAFYRKLSALGLDVEITSNMDS